MPNLSNMLKKESISIKKDQIVKRSDCMDILISSRFEDDHIHHILPSQEITNRIVFDLLSYLNLEKEEFNYMLIKLCGEYIRRNGEGSFDEVIDLIGKIKDDLNGYRRRINYTTLKLEDLKKEGN